MTARPPNTIIECVEDLVSCIEYSRECDNEIQMANLLFNIRESLVAYLKLKEWVSEGLEGRYDNENTE